MNNYTIGEIAKKTNLSVYTLRYYEKEGLLPFVKRDSNGHRIFSDRDIILLNTIECMKSTGLSIKDMKQYVDWCTEGFSTVPQRYELMLHQKDIIDQQIAAKQKILAAITYKCEYYQQALKTGSTDMCEKDREAWANKLLNGKI